MIQAGSVEVTYYCSNKLLHPRDMNGNIKKLQYGYFIADIHTWLILVLSCRRGRYVGVFFHNPLNNRDATFLFECAPPPAAGRLYSTRICLSQLLILYCGQIGSYPLDGGRSRKVVFCWKTWNPGQAEFGGWVLEVFCFW